VSAITRFEEIRAWQTARTLTKQVYEVSSRAAFARDYGLRDQLRRAAVSVMSNIAEGYESETQEQFIRCLGYAKASAGEVRSQLYVALDVGYLDHVQFEAPYDLADKCSRQLSRFVAYLRTQAGGRRIRELGAEYDEQSG
jgi:four helix bundle protein